MLDFVDRRSATGCNTVHNHFSLQQALWVLVLNFGFWNFIDRFSDSILLSDLVSDIFYDT
jgi:hypothetical protein